MKRMLALALLAVPLTVASWPMQAKAREVVRTTTVTTYTTTVYRRVWVPGHWDRTYYGAYFWVPGHYVLVY